MTRSPSTLPLVACNRASVTLAGHPALEDVSFTLGRGEAWLILGQNGSGKSTLLRLLRGDIWPDDDGRGSRTFFPDGGKGRPSPLGLRHRFGMDSSSFSVGPRGKTSMRRPKPQCRVASGGAGVQGGPGFLEGISPGPWPDDATGSGWAPYSRRAAARR